MAVTLRELIENPETYKKYFGENPPDRYLCEDLLQKFKKKRLAFEWETHRTGPVHDSFREERNIDPDI